MIPLKKPSQQDIEYRLRTTAQRMLTLGSAEIPKAVIFQEHARRERCRRFRRRAANGVTLILLCGAWVLVNEGHQAPDEQASIQTPATDPQLAPGPPLAGMGRNAPPAADVPGQSDGFSLGIPILVEVGQHGGQPIVAPAIYIPPQVRRLDEAALTPAERLGVQRLLGIETRVQDNVVTL